jgi:glutathione peroxidase
MRNRFSLLFSTAALVTGAVLTIVAGSTWALAAAISAHDDAAADTMPASFYDLKTTMLDGKPADLGQYRGKVTLVVNVASKCGFTPQYTGLEKLHRELKDKGFAVLGFPSNDFGGQEPGTAEEIQQFCKLTYDVSFPMFSKVVTKKTDGQSPIYTYLGSTGNLPGWNFSKYLVGKDGKVVAFYSSKIKPEDAELRTAIDKALAN